ncbi:MAG: class I SAM-dependent methyltransferase [Bacteroidota bacterium]
MSNQLTCPSCTASNMKAWGEKNGFTLYQCNDCTHIFADMSAHDWGKDNPESFRKTMTNNRPDDDLKYYEHLATGEPKGRNVYNTTQLILKTTKDFSKQGLKSWLDVGCGSGFLLSTLKKQNWEVTGVEPGAWGQIAAKKKEVTIVQGFLTKNTFKKKFDVVSAIDVLEHQADPSEFIQIAKHNLIDKGKIVIIIPFADSFHCKVFKDKWGMVAPPSHCQYFTYKSFETFVNRHGLNIDKQAQFNAGRPRAFWRTRLTRAVIDTFVAVTLGGDQSLFILSKK